MKHLYYRFYLLCLCAALTFAQNSVALENAVKPVEEKYESYQSIPSIFQNHLKANITLEKYLLLTMQEFRKNIGLENQELTTELIEQAKTESKHALQKIRITQLFGYDLNLDGMITRKEALEYIIQQQESGHPNFSGTPEDLVEDAFQRDTDNNDIIDLNEMKALTQQDLYQIRTPLEEYIEIDPNSDGKLTSSELYQLATKAFMTLDTDEDLTISEIEYSKFFNNAGTTRGSTIFFPACKFTGIKFPENMDVYAAGGYTESGSTIEVMVNSPSIPVALILSSYPAVTWKINKIKNTNITAILVGGYEKPSIIGVDEAVPILINAHEFEGPCGWFDFNDSQNLALLNPLSRAAFNRSVKLYIPVKDNKVIVGEEEFSAPDFETNSGKAPITNEKKVKTEKEKLDEALNTSIDKRVLRRATKEDFLLWDKKRKESISELPPIKSDKEESFSELEGIDFSRAFVVLKDYTFPKGLYGANAATFLISEGVKRPNGVYGHSTVYDMNTLSCYGASPYCAESLSSQHQRPE
ncbi:MAG: hypothetical protein KDI61_00815 [Alphaproteobacteria bacterium]|nr:hypothetical protein [Alphaproteobacteria bacterium]